MDLEYSFRYTFSGVINLFYSNEIVCTHHLVSPENLMSHPDEGFILVPTGPGHWGFNVVSTLGYNPFELQNKIRDSEKFSIGYITENLLNKTELLAFFAEKIEEKIKSVEGLIKDKDSFHASIKKENIIVTYLGYPEEVNSGGYPIPEKMEYPRDEIHNMLFERAQQYFIQIHSFMERMTVFLYHHINLHSLEEKKLRNQKGKDDLISLLEENRIKELFNEFRNDPNFQYRPSIILLSNRYNALQKEKANDILSREQYEKSYNNLMHSLLEEILKD